MESINARRPINSTLAVIDGGLNFKAGVESLPATPKPKLLDQVSQAIRTRITVPRPKTVMFIGSNGSSFSTTSVIPQKWRNRR